MYIKSPIIFVIFLKVTLFVQLVGCDNDTYNNNIGDNTNNNWKNDTRTINVLSRSRRYLGFKKGHRVFVSIFSIIFK